MKLMLTGQSLVKRDLRAFEGEGIDSLRSLLRGADCAFTNYEGTINGVFGGWPMKDRFIHASDPVVLDTLKDFGFNLLSLANNHSFDLGPGGILSALEECELRGLANAGVGADRTASGRAGVLRTAAGSVALVAMHSSNHGEVMYARDATRLIPARPGVNPLHVRRGIRVPQSMYDAMLATSSALGNELRKADRLRMGFPQLAGEGGMDFYGAWVEPGESPEEIFHPEPAELARNLATIAAAAQQHDIVIAYLHQHHFAPDWQDTPEWLRRVGRDCIEAGATAFVSHGAPMLLGMEFHQGRPMLHGMGNFIFHTYRVENYIDEASWESIVVEMDMKVDGVELTAHPIFLRAPDREYPELATGAQARRILTSFDALSRPLGVRVDTRTGRCTALAR